MGTGNLLDREDGQTIDATWFDTVRDALLIDLLARNASGVPADLAGSLGGTSNRWLYAYLQELKLGVASNKFVGLKAHASTPVDGFNITLPSALPSSGQKRPMILDENGNVLYTGGYSLSSSSGLFSTTSFASWVDVTNLSVNLTTSGRPVMLVLIPDGTSLASFGAESSTVSLASANWRFLRDTSTVVGAGVVTARGFENELGGGGGTDIFSEVFVAPGSLVMWDFVAAGTYNYKFSMQCNGSGQTGRCSNSKLLAMEL